MRVDEVLTLLGYNEWANHRVLDAAERLPEERLRAPDVVSHGSLYGTLAHVLAAEWMWRTRCEDGISPPSLLSDRDFPDLGTMRERWEEEMSAMRSYIGSLDDPALRNEVSYANTKGVVFQTPLWQILLHVVNHGTQFRSEAAVLLSRHGASPGDLDLIAYLRQLPA